MSDGLRFVGALTVAGAAAQVVTFEINPTDARDLVSSFAWFYENSMRTLFPPAPQYARPGQGEIIPDILGGVLTVDAFTGMWRNGRMMGQMVNGTFQQAKCAVLMTYGDEIFGRGPTDKLWWQWRGDHWLLLDQTQLDPAIFIIASLDPPQDTA